MYYGLSFTIIAFLIVIIAQYKINSSYSKYKLVKNNKKITGQEVARKILDANGLDKVYVVEVKGTLTDHYDPTRKVVRLSNEIFHGDSIASISVAAHECGHAIQDKENYTFMKIRSLLVPIVNFISYLGYFGLIIAIFAGMTGYIKVSILILFVTVLFQLVTLPVELNASKRAEEQLIKLDLINDYEKNGVSEVLKSAALTYVASLASTILNLLRLIFILNRNDD